MIKTVIFDLDGTIIDSEENYYEADRMLFNERGVEFTREMKEEFIGSGNWEMMKRIKKEYGFSETAEELLKRKNELYLNLARENTPVYPEMMRFIQILHERGVPLAVASGTSPEIIDEILGRLEITGYFKVIASAEHVENGKPAPDLFLYTAEKLGSSPSGCLVLEDSKYGVEAAKRAGMKCAGIPYIVDSRLHESFCKADILFKKGMGEFSAEKMIEWIEKENNR